MIVKLLERKNNGLIEFESKFGRGLGKFDGFLENQNIDVELDLDDEFNWKENINLADSQNYNLSNDGNKTMLVSRLEALHLDGTAVLRFDSACILIEVHGIPSNMLGRYVAIMTETLSIHLTNI